MTWAAWLAHLTFDQIMIIVLGSIGVTLAQALDMRWRRWASVVGLASEPFWFYTASAQAQPGVFFMCFIYTAAFAWGAYNCWIVAPRREKAR